MGKLIAKLLTVKTAKVTVKQNGKVYIGYGATYVDAFRTIDNAIKANERGAK